MPALSDDPVLALPNREAWEKWLADHHSSSRGLWLQLAKKGAGVGGVSYLEAVEVALSYGWIDGQAGAIDASSWRQRFTPRGPRSKWSQINRAKADELIARGDMKPAGLREVERAKEDGRWEAAYAGARLAEVPEDLARELQRSPTAAEFFASLNGTNRYAILYRIQDAKKPETRARRIAKFVAMLAEGKKIYP
jgi:uncharacterized protein YdeI (YjbR/CyaY-like superfamily)